MDIRISFGFGNNEKSIAQREFKGKSLLKELDDYVVLDLETTGLDPDYDDIIEMAAIKVENKNIVDQFQSLVNPGYEIDDFITDLTGITNEMLKDAPGVKNVLPQFLSFIGDSVIVAHNANFDINFLYDACGCLKPSMYFKNDFVDTMRLSRRLFVKERHHRLSDLAERFGIKGSVEHRALSDVIKTNQCYDYMKRYAKNSGILFESLYPLHKTGVRASDITATTSEFDETNAIFGKIFVFTGALQRMVRKDAMQLVVNMGGKCGDGVTKDTNYLVLGNNDYCSSIKDGKSSKQKKAEKYKASGRDIEIISENVFYEMLSENS
ncbi:exonuclease domain-containing protein [Caproiciproducens galactitolivorans]|uniref:Exonuclease domain-containing protein n=1 Tax=Caproiciproducens galactitolivorans TaxID=642589 RepID=A0ABT4BVT3_9FIRM|nr:exonuclease domain-containing protein [Caproiciproducens galactitolivorans]MCY1714043.1 exonuclease domain-containing protein [Caproiciproducens galactitolivorans]